MYNVVGHSMMLGATMRLRRLGHQHIRLEHISCQTVMSVPLHLGFYRYDSLRSKPKELLLAGAY